MNGALETNIRSLRTLAQRSALWIRMGMSEEAKAQAYETLTYDPLDVSSYMTLYLGGDLDAAVKIQDILKGKTVAYINLAEYYLSAGLYEEGMKASELGADILSTTLAGYTIESSNSPEGKNIIIGSPLFLTREVSDTFVDVILEPEKIQKTLSLANAISIKKLRGSILN